MSSNWSIQGKKDPEVVRPDWSPVNPPTMDGVVARQVANVLTSNGYLTEIWRPDWELDDLPVGQVFQRLRAHGSGGRERLHPAGPPNSRPPGQTGACSGRIDLSL